MLEKQSTMLIYDIDDSIKSKTSITDLLIMRSFTEFKNYTENKPTVLETLIMTSSDVPFTNSRIGDFLEIVGSPFMKVNEIIYLIDPEMDRDLILGFLEMNGITNWTVIQGDVDSDKFIEDIVSGEGRLTNLPSTVVVKYMVSVQEYMKYKELQASEEDSYVHQLDDIKVDDVIKPKDIKMSGTKTNIRHVVGIDNHERTSMVLVIAQRLALNGRVIIVEKDTKYHRLTDYITKLDIPYTLVQIEDLYKDVKETLRSINNAPNNLVVIGCKKRLKYSYSFVFDLIYDNIEENTTFIRECEFEETPYGFNYLVTTPPTVPDILKTVQSLKYEIDDTAMFVAVDLTNLNPVELTLMECKSVLSITLNKNINNAHYINLKGLKLKGGELNDLSSIINHYTRRQD